MVSTPAATPTGTPSACTRTLSAEPPRSREPYISAAVWLDAQQIAVFIGGNGLVVHDAGTGKRTRAWSGFSPEWAVEWATLRGGSTTELLLAGKKLGVATLHLETGCLRAPGAVKVWHAAIDAAGGRFFVISEAGELSRVDAATLTKSAAEPPHSASAVAYEPLTRTVITLSGNVARFYAPDTLEALGSMDLPISIKAGPWVRPGYKEVAFIYETPCTQWGPMEKNPRCLRGAEWGLLLVDVARRVEIARLPATKWVGLGPGSGAWSRDGSVFTLQGFDAITWRVEAKRVAVNALPRREYSQIFLGPDAESYLANKGGDSYIQLRSLSGVVAWGAPLPSLHDP